MTLPQTPCTVYVCVFVLCSDERDLDGFSVSKCDAVCFCLSHSKSQRPLSLTTEGSLYVYMASSTNRMHAEHVHENMHMQTLMHCMCALLHSNPHTHAQLIGRVMHCPWQIIPRCTRIAPNISEHLFQCFPNTCFEYHIKKHSVFLTQLRRGFVLDEWLFMLIESRFDSEIILPC